MERLENPVRDYAWGSADDIPEFVGLDADGGPVAEMWIGAHPDSPSLLLRDGGRQSLADIIAARPEAELGPAVTRRFGPRLPFLVKLISAAAPLSLQVHPDKAHAEQAYAAQQRTPGGPRDYTDDNHKPELICALRDGFAGLCGFRPPAETGHLLAEIGATGLAEMADQLAADPAGGLRATVTTLLTSSADHRPLIESVRRGCERSAATGGRWASACAAYATIAAAYPADPGVLVALLLNYVELAAGEAVFVEAGVPHCYLHGFGAELMASSDNVLRAGLTSKRVNVPELLRLLAFQAAEPTILSAVPCGSAGSSRPGYQPWAVYPTPVEDFQLSRLEVTGPAVPVPAGKPQVFLCIAGAADLRDAAGRRLELTRGRSAYVSAGDTGVSIAGTAAVLQATVGTTT